MPKQITEAHLKQVAKNAAVSAAARAAARLKADAARPKKYKPKDVEAWKVFKKFAAHVERESDAAVAHMPQKTVQQRFARVMAKAKYIRDNERRFIAEAKISPAMEKRLRTIAEDPNLPQDI